jgi:hypothetical protein
LSINTTAAAKRKTWENTYLVCFCTWLQSCQR